MCLSDYMFQLALSLPAQGNVEIFSAQGLKITSEMPSAWTVPRKMLQRRAAKQRKGAGSFQWTWPSFPLAEGQSRFITETCAIHVQIPAQGHSEISLGRATETHPKKNRQEAKSSTNW